LKILIELPTWLGDAVMTTPAIENLCYKYPDAKITLFGSFVSTEALRLHPQVEKVVIDESKKATIRAWWLYKKSKEIGEFDLSVTFRRRFYSKLLQFFLTSKQKFIYKRVTKETRHQVLRYNDFLDLGLECYKLKLYHKPKKYDKPTLGINPGATAFAVIPRMANSLASDFVSPIKPALLAE